MNVEEARKRYNDLILDGATHPHPSVEAAWKDLVDAIIWDALSLVNVQDFEITSAPRGAD